MSTQIARPLTVAEVADRLAVSVSTVRNIIRAGKLPVLSIGRAHRVEPNALDAYLDNLRKEARERAEEAQRHG